MEDFLTSITEHIDANLVILVPVLNAIGALIKRSEVVRPDNIPMILQAVAFVMVVGYKGFLFESVVQSVLITAMAVYGHNIYKQGFKDLKGKGDKYD